MRWYQCQPLMINISCDNKNEDRTAGIASALAVGLFGGSVLAPCRQGGNKNRRWLDQHLIYKGNIWCCTMVYSLSGILWFMDMIWGWATTYDIRLLGEWTCICKSFHFGVNMCEQQGTRVLTYIYFYRYNIYISSYCAYCVVLAPSRNGSCWVWNMLKNLKDAFSVTNRTLNSAFPAPKLANLMHPAMLIPTWGRIAFWNNSMGFFRFSSWRGEFCLKFRNYWGSFQVHSTRCCRSGSHSILRLWSFDSWRYGHFCAPWAQDKDAEWPVAAGRTSRTAIRLSRWV